MVISAARQSDLYRAASGNFSRMNHRGNAPELCTVAGPFQLDAFVLKAHYST